MVNHYIGADVHSNNVELAIERNGQIIQRHALPTSVRAIREVLDSIPSPKHLTFEEGPLAGWLYRNLKDHVDTLVVCDPRRNRLVSCDGDKDDRIDATKLARLLRGGYLRAVYHSDDLRRLSLKRWVALYHDRVRAATRAINQLRACARLYGERIPRSALREVTARRTWLAGLDRDLADQLQLLWRSYDSHRTSVRMAKRHLLRRARRFGIIAYWSVLPGIGPIRSATLFAYLDTPWRFEKKTQLWKYCGVGLQRSSSGKDRRGRDRPPRLELFWRVNHRLKDAVMGMTLSAIRSRDNVFRDAYEERTRHGALASNARHAVARKMLTVIWGMWKSQRPFDASLC
jgi:transposase